MPHTLKTDSWWRSRRLRLTLAVPLLLAVVFLLIQWRKHVTRDSVPPIPTAVLSPMGPNGQREWSTEVVHYPGFQVGEENREWSHREIALRHKALVLKELPDYITELHGFGAKHETNGTSASWFFVVPPERMEEFKKYLLSLGILADALYESKYIQAPLEYQDIKNRPPPLRFRQPN